MALDTDIANPDSALNVRFYSKPIQNAFKTQLEGRPIFDDCDFVTIWLPGDKNTIIDTFVDDSHKRRFPLHWAHYKNTHGDNLQSGTPLSAWQLLTPAQAEELKALKFYTVESIATASDMQIQNIGMIAGMAPHAFRDRAVRYLKAAEGDASYNQQAEETKKLAEKNAELEKQMADMQSMMKELLANQKAKPGPKPRQESEQSDASHAA